MKDFGEAGINRWRIRRGAMGSDDNIGNCGAFRIPRDYRSSYIVNASDGHPDTEWEHVSVRISGKTKKEEVEDSTPTWRDMCYIKTLFFDPAECVVQYHPPDTIYLIHHQHVLHLWRPRAAGMPMPPKEFV